jgi:hypothetical protein
MQGPGGEIAMTAYNAVRFRVKPGQEEAFIEAHRKPISGLKGFVKGALIKTGDRTYCFIAEWKDFQSIVDSRPAMIAILDTMRNTLEDLGNGLGVTDPVSGEAVVELKG